ncbi:MAG: hypothetical protein ACXAEI_08010 [Candidatus Hodarchaeales archaeon]
MDLSSGHLYEEKILSKITAGVFIVLTALFMILFSCQFIGSGYSAFTLISFSLFLFFLFYSLNYRSLTIFITSSSVEIKFGIFSRSIGWESIDECHIDEVSMWRIGGAGIHFTRIRRKWRAMYNFLEYPRIVLTLKQGRIREVVFSTRNPERVLAIVKQGILQQERK